MYTPCYAEVVHPPQVFWWPLALPTQAPSPKAKVIIRPYNWLSPTKPKPEGIHIRFTWYLDLLTLRSSHPLETGMATLFCPSCSNLLVISAETGVNKWACNTCPYEFPITKQMTSRTRLKRKKTDDVLGGEEMWKHADSIAGEFPNFHPPRSPPLGWGLFRRGRRVMIPVLPRLY